MTRFINDSYLSRTQIHSVLSESAPDGTNAFYGDADLKRKFVERAVLHRSLDEIEHGIYWNPHDAQGNDLGFGWGYGEEGRFGDSHPDYSKHRGCAVGCLSHATENAHMVLSRMTGIPEPLCYLMDTLFESYHSSINGELTDWDKNLPRDVMDAIPVGADLSDVTRQMIARCLELADAPKNIIAAFSNPSTDLSELRELLYDEYGTHTYDTGFWGIFVSYENALDVRETLLTALRNAPVAAKSSVETPQLVSDLIDQIVTPVEVAVLA